MENNLVSIVVIAYNHLDYTRKCIESVLQYTADIDYELITINNGSSDGTKEYFDTLPHAKKINYTQNIGVDKAINFGFAMAEGKYTLNLSNDIVVTHNWLKNLLTCMESDEKIGMVVPVCGYSSNFQKVELPYDTLEEMHEQARKYNISNPRLWEERLRLVTYTCLFRTDVQKSIGGFDEDFNPGGYDDDAISFTIRRLGYKLILAKDTYVHHYGSVTFNVEYTVNNLAERNRNLFREKFGVDSWGSAMIDFNIVSLIEYSGKTENENMNILGIGSSCGSTLLQIKNEFKKSDVWGVKLFYLSQAPNCIPDLKTICEFCLCGEPSDASYYFKNIEFDYIILENDPSELKDMELVFTNLLHNLKDDGKILCTAKDEKVLSEIEKLLSQNGLKNEKSINNYYYSFGHGETPSEII